VGTVTSVSPDAILHDVAADTGNSGGPIVNGRGEVVGMNFANKETGFALPSDILESELEHLRSGVYGIGPAELGIRVDPSPVPLTDEQRAQLPDPSQRYGVAIDEVLAGYSAEEVGLAAGDVIVLWSSDPVESGEQFDGLVAHLSLRTCVTISFFRGDTVYTALLIPQESR
jgi:S1-C subfamily serine protease